MARLNRKLLRDLASHWAQVTAIVCVIGLGIVMFTGPLLATRDLHDSVEEIYERTRYEDFSVRMGTAPASVAADVEALAEVEAVEGRLVRDTQAFVDGHKLTARVISVPDEGRPSVNDVIVQEGRYLQDGAEDEVMVEKHLADELGLVPGSTITVSGDRREHVLKVTGVVTSPEYLRLVRSLAEYVTDPAQFGVVFVRHSQAGRMFDSPGTVNEIVARVGDEKRLKAAMDAAAEVLKPYGVTGLTAGADEPGAVTLSLEMQDINRIALFFSLLLLAVASLAVYITMTQIVYSQQREIGVTRAIGYGKRTISAHYMGYGIVLGAAGSALGILIGYFLSSVYAGIYSDVFGIPLLGKALHPSIVLAAVVTGLGFAVLGALVPARHAIRMKPADAMRTQAGVALGAGARKGPKTSERRVSSWLRIAFRNLGRNRRRTLLTWLGVVGTIALMVTSSGGKDSIDYGVDKYLNGVLKWDVAGVWPVAIGPETLEQVRSIEGVARVEPFIDVPGRVVAGGKSSDVQVQAYERGSLMHGEYPVAGSPAYPGPGEVLLNKGIRTKLPGVKQGGFVTVTTPVGALPFKVAGFVSEPFGGVSYVNFDYVQALSARITGGPDRFNGVVLTVEPGASAVEVGDRLRDFPDVAQVITKSGVERIFEEVVGAIKALFVIFYVMAFAMGFAVIFSMITVNLLERSREIATIRTLGAGRSTIFSFLTVETGVVVLAALVPGVLLGRFLEWIIIDRLLTSDRLAPDTVISWVTVLFILIASIGVMLISELPSVRKLWKLDLARMTKERAD